MSDVINVTWHLIGGGVFTLGIAVIAYKLCPDKWSKKEKLCASFGTGIIAMSFSQFYTEEKYNFVIEACKCNFWAKLWRWFCGEGWTCSQVCPKVNVGQLITLFHIKSNILVLLSSFGSYLFLKIFIDSGMFKTAQCLNQGYEKLIDGVSCKNWYNPMAWLRSFFFISIPKPIIVLTFMSVGFAITWKLYGMFFAYAFPQVSTHLMKNLQPEASVTQSEPRNSTNANISHQFLPGWVNCLFAYASFMQGNFSYFADSILQIIG